MFFLSQVGPFGGNKLESVHLVVLNTICVSLDYDGHIVVKGQL